MSDIDDEKIRRLDGGLLLVLRELLRHRRTTVAAEHLGMSQSAVSHALGRLRNLLDDPLFVRRPHGLEPTPRALELGPRVDQLLASMSAVLGIDDDFDPATGRHTFRICAPDHVTTILLPELVDRMATHAPGCRTSVDQRLGDDAIEALRRHEADVVLGRFGARLPRDVTAELLFEDTYCLAIRAGHPAAAERLTLDAHRALDHVVVSVTGDFRTLDIESAGRRSRPVRVVASVPRFTTALAIVAGSDVVAIAPRRLVTTLGPSFGVVAHDLPMPTDRIEVMAVHRRDPSPATRWLVDLLHRLDAARPAASSSH
ncbi:MAG: LysR family transcriptional regulator [Actinobacteria bacterium]|nr:LysR family transcriptional regulator [Actinomycetota bacterium]